MRTELLRYQKKVRLTINEYQKILANRKSADEIRNRLLLGKKADGTYLPTYSIITLERKKRQKTLFGDGVHWSLKQNGGFHTSIVIKDGKAKADVKSGLSKLLKSRGITIKEILGD